MEVANTSRKVSDLQPTAGSRRRRPDMTDQSWLSSNQTLLETNQWLTNNLTSFNAFSNVSFNGTIDDFELVAQGTKLNGSEHGSGFCAKWYSAQQDLFQAANLCFALAFLVPKSFKQSVLLLRALVAGGGVLMSMWAGAEICAPDVLAWSLALAMLNSTHTVVLIIRFLPPVLSLELTDLYLKMFKPLKVSKKHFQELTKESRIVKLEPGEAYALEEVTPADERLSILLKGKMRVSCDDTLLHYINPYQFVDSPEWEANRDHSDDVFQVTVVAEEVCTCVCWPRMRLERVLRHRPGLKVVLDSLIGKDITQKLYSVSEGLSGVVADREGMAASVRRSASVDAVHEGTRGRVRSDAWRAGSRPSGGLFGPMVARQFLRNSPFNRSVQVPRLVPQASSSSLQPPPPRAMSPVARTMSPVARTMSPVARTMSPVAKTMSPVTRTVSPPRRAPSFRKPREVKFAEEEEGKV